MFVQWRALVFVLIFHEFVYKTTCGFNIEFLQNCDNQQVSLVLIKVMDMNVYDIASIYPLIGVLRNWGIRGKKFKP